MTGSDFLKSPRINILTILMLSSINSNILYIISNICSNSSPVLTLLHGSIAKKNKVNYGMFCLIHWDRLAKLSVFSPAPQRALFYMYDVQMFPTVLLNDNGFTFKIHQRLGSCAMRALQKLCFQHIAPVRQNYFSSSRSAIFNIIPQLIRRKKIS